METIRDRDGNAVQRSRNLAGIRRYVSTHIIERLAVDMTSNGCGMLSILFDNGCSFQTSFADYSGLTDLVRRWRNVLGSPLLVNGWPAGEVSKDCPADIRLDSLPVIGMPADR